MKFPLAVVSALGLCQCASQFPGTAEGINTNPFELLEQQASASNRDANRILIPFLHAPDHERRWGKPRLLVDSTGGYALRYQNPITTTEHVTILGSPKKFERAGSTPPPYTDVRNNPEKMIFTPIEVSQKWQSTRIAGSTVRYYISQGESGGKPMQYSTETFQLAAPDDRKASYRIRVSSDRSDHLSPAPSRAVLTRTPWHPPLGEFSLESGEFKRRQRLALSQLKQLGLYRTPHGSPT